MKSVWAVLGLACAAGLLSVGCNNGTCTFVSKCGADPAPTANDTTLCDNRKNDSQCGGHFNDYLACYQSNQVCTSTGTTDQTITNGLCGDSFAKWEDCYYGIDGSAYIDGGSE